MNKQLQPELLVDDAHGIYIPQRFAQRWPLTHLKGVNQEQLDTLLAGPDGADYWEVWWEVLTQCTMEFEGEKHTLHQDGDLWAIPPGYVIPDND